MRRFAGIVAVVAIVAVGSGGARADDATSEVQAALARRSALAQGGSVNLREMSAAIRAAVTEAERLERVGNYPAALEHLRSLETYGTLADLPSLEVQTLAAWLLMKQGDPTTAALHRARADALRQVLTRQVGAGTPEDPLKLVLASEIGEWARASLVRLTEVKEQPQPGREMVVASYVGPTTHFQPKTLYAEMAPQRPAPVVDNVFTPVPPDRQDDRYLALLHDAQARRQRFLEDHGFSFLALQAGLQAAMTDALALAQAGKADDALERLRKLEKIRPLEEIPTPELIALYSMLCGKADEPETQARLRGLLFGINQAIGHSGDGAGTDTAVQVILVAEEYHWLRERRLKAGRQRLLQTPAGTFDVITARDAVGIEREYYFNVTGLFARTADSFPAGN